MMLVSTQLVADKITLLWSKMFTCSLLLAKMYITRRSVDERGNGNDHVLLKDHSPSHL